MSDYTVYQAGGLVKAWVNGVPFEDQARLQLERISRLPFIYKWVVALPDVHLGIGATVGSVIVTKGAVIPAAVGVDIGCSVLGVRTGLTSEDIVTGWGSLAALRTRIEKRVPTGFGAHKKIHRDAKRAWADLQEDYEKIVKILPAVEHKNVLSQLGSLGGGNHFIEISYDENKNVWVLIHSGSRGAGNRIGVQYIKRAKELCKSWHVKLEDPDLAYFPQSCVEYEQYLYAMNWAQQYAKVNRALMMQFVLEILGTTAVETIDCPHNFAQLENHYGENVLVTRKGATSAREGQMGVLPGSMGTSTYIVEGLGNKESFNSCAHGAGRIMSRKKAKASITVEDHQKATAGIECRKDVGMLDESPAAYKDIESVLEAQKTLSKPVHTINQMVCVKG